MLGRVKKDVESRVRAGVELIGRTPDVIVVHRDSDNVDPEERRAEIESGVRNVATESHHIPVIPIKMTEAWLLLDEGAIRMAAGNPAGRIALGLPKANEVESRADPKAILSECILKASELTGRRRDKLSKRFPRNRRQIFEKLNTRGSITTLTSWISLIADIDRVVLDLHNE